MSSDITAANAVFLISVPTLIPVPVQLQGFSADDIFDMEEVETSETLMGVDGVFSGGMIYAAKPQTIRLQADSASNDFFDQWYQGMQVNTAVFPALGTVTFPALGKSWNLVTGYLRRYMPMPSAKKLLQPRAYRIEWGSIVVSPVGLAG